MASFTELIKKKNQNERSNVKKLKTYKLRVSFQTGSRVRGFIVVSWNFCRLLDIQTEQYGSLIPRNESKHLMKCFN